MADTDMYFPVGYETYQEAPQGNQALKNGMEAQLPPEHTIKRGWMPFLYPNTNEGYEQAKANLKNPLLADSLALKGSPQRRGCPIQHLLYGMPRCRRRRTGNLGTT